MAELWNSLRIAPWLTLVVFHASYPMASDPVADGEPGVRRGRGSCGHSAAVSARRRYGIGLALVVLRETIVGLVKKPAQLSRWTVPREEDLATREAAGQAST